MAIPKDLATQELQRFCEYMGISPEEDTRFSAVLDHVMSERFKISDEGAGTYHYLRPPADSPTAVFRLPTARATLVASRAKGLMVYDYTAQLIGVESADFYDIQRCDESPLTDIGHLIMEG